MRSDEEYRSVFFSYIRRGHNNDSNFARAFWNSFFSVTHRCCIVSTNETIIVNEASNESEVMVNLLMSNIKTGE